MTTHVWLLTGRPKPIRGRRWVNIAVIFRRSSLAVSEVVFPDFLADRDDNPLPADHRSHAQCECDCHFHPIRYELGGAVDVSLVIFQHGRRSAVEKLRFAGLLHQGGALHSLHTCRFRKLRTLS